MEGALLPEGGGDEPHESPLQRASDLEHATGGLLEGTGLDGLRNEGHPGVEDAVLQAAEGLAEGHVADDVKGGEVCNYG